MNRWCFAIGCVISVALLLASLYLANYVNLMLRGMLQ